MSKRNKRSAHRQPVPATSPEDARARVESLIASGNTREALDLAKQRFKATRSHEDVALLLTAYEARIGALLARGQRDEAAMLAERVGERFPAHRHRLASLVSQSRAAAAGDPRTLIAELAVAGPARRKEIEAILTRELRDPRLLAEAEALGADDPLRRSARAVCDLFAAVTTGPLPEGALGALDQISRHSPLAPWKLLIRALDAYYRREDGSALANLEAIAPHSPPARLVPVLRHLMGQPAAVDQRSPAVGALIRAVGGGRTALRDHLPRLARALEAREIGKAVAAVEAIMPLLEAEPAPVKRAFTATVLWHWRRLDLNPKPLILALCRDRRDLDGQRETHRLIALTLERTGAWEEALVSWDVYLASATRAGILTPAARARVLLRMAELLPADLDEIQDAFGVASQADLDSMIRRGELPECFDRGRLLERAREADPGSGVFRALVAHWAARDPRRAEAEAEAWRQAHPRDLEPLLRLVSAAERRGAHRRALDLLDEAEAIDRVHPDVRQSRFRLLLASAERRIREGRFALALEDLDRLEKEPAATSGDTWAYLGAIRWVATRRGGDGAAAAELHRELAARLGNASMLALTLSSVAGAFGLDPPALDEGSPSECVQGLARASDLFRALNRALAVPPALLARVEENLGGASPADLHSLCVGGLHMGQPALAYAAAGEGLAAEGPMLHRFLLARGRALSAAATRRDRDRAGLCLRAARELAGRARDMDAVREASSALDALARRAEVAPWAPPVPAADPRPPGAEAIARLVATERALRRAPAFTAEKKPRKLRRAPRRGQSDLFDDFLAFLDKHL